jgi:zinc D-Ala-D-Ala carboxypeptidase
MTAQIIIPWRWPDFTPDEMRCKGSGECRMDPEFMDRLQRVRRAYGQPMRVTSGYRSPTYNAKISGTGIDGPHTTGRAADISVSGDDAYHLVRIAMDQGFTGIGVSQRGPHESRFIHLDDLEGSATRPRIWSY